MNTELFIGLKEEIATLRKLIKMLLYALDDHQILEYEEYMSEEDSEVFINIINSKDQIKHIRKRLA